MGIPLVLVGLAFTGVFASVASAGSLQIAPEGFAVRMVDAKGSPEYVSGAHPDLRIDFALEVEETTVRDLVFELPPGFSLDASAVPRCPQSLVEAGEECPASSKVGEFEMVIANGAKTEIPLFMLESSPGEPPKIGTKPSLSVPVTTELRPSDFGLTVHASDLPQGAIVEGHLALWGVPADHLEGASGPRLALLSAPTACGPLRFGFRTRSWDEGAPWLDAEAETAPLGGCETLGFAPRISVRLSNPVVDAPTGMQTELSLPQESDAGERAQAQIKDVTIEMPDGIALSPGGAATLTACSDAQLGLGESGEARCPPSSKVGSVELATPAFEGTLTGTIYLGAEAPGERFRVFVVAEAAGTIIKSVGVMRISAETGRLSTVLEGLPPLALSRMVMSFDGGPGALLVTPLSCGTVSAVARFSSYAGGPPVTTSGAAAISAGPGGSPCGPPPFAPQLSTAVSSHRAGKPTTFSSVVRRRPGEQMPSRFSITLPAGLNASLGGVDLCSDSDAAADNCPLASRVGEVAAEIGSPPSAARLKGALYFTEPHGNAPLGTLVQISNKLGPFDFGTLTMRGAGELSSRTGRLTVAMDRLPAAVEGVPVRFQSLELSIDRPGLVHNPTSCGPNSTDARFVAADGASASASVPLVVRGCKRLGFQPKISMSLLGRRQLYEGGKPGLRVAMRFRPGDANPRSVRMALPAALSFSTAAVSAICSRRDAEADRCPSGARMGSVRAKSSLLKKPLSGVVYAVQPRGNGLPDVWTRLSGEGVSVSMRSKASSVDGRPALSIEEMPDVALSTFSMRLRPGGISLDTRPCIEGRPRRLSARAEIEAQNGKRRSLAVGVALEPRCGTGSL